MKKYIVLFTIVSPFFFSGCGLYLLSPFGSCNQWEIYSEEEKYTDTFKMNVCGEKLGYKHSYLDRMELKDIQNIVYPKLKKLIQNQSSLSGCRVKKESITFGYGMPRDPIDANVVCVKEISFERQEGRFSLTSFPF